MLGVEVVVGHGVQFHGVARDPAYLGSLQVAEVTDDAVRRTLRLGPCLGAGVDFHDVAVYHPVLFAAARALDVDAREREVRQRRRVGFDALAVDGHAVQRGLQCALNVYRLPHPLTALDSDLSMAWASLAS